MSLSTSSRSAMNRDAMRFAVRGTVFRMDPSGTSHFEETTDPAAAYKTTLTAGRITAMGDRYATCGDEHPHFCSQCGKPVKDDDGNLVTIGETCWRQECPRCGAGWSMRRAIPIVSKIESLRKEIASKRGDSPKFHHLAVRMDDFRAARDADDAFFDVVKAAVDEVGVNVHGGAIIHHSYTGDNEDHEDDDLGKWKERVFEGRDWEGDVEDELKEWHHAHVIVLADHIDHFCCESLFDRTGIFVHRIQNEDDDNNVSIYGKKELAEVTTYCLSHARLADDADAYRYFGAVANHSADHRIEAMCKEIVRSVVPKTLDLQLPESELCSRTIAASEVDHIPAVVRGPSRDSEAEDDEIDTDESDDDQQDDQGDQKDRQDDQGDQKDRQDDQGDQREEDTEQANEDGLDGDDSDEEQVTNIDWEAADAPKSGDTPVKCNGRLVPLEFAPSFLDDPDRNLAYEDELREAYREHPVQETLDEHTE